MIYREAKIGDWLRIKSQPISNIYIKAQNGLAYCFYSNEKDNIGNKYLPEENEIVFFTSSFWNDISFPIFHRKPPSQDIPTMPQLFTMKYNTGYRYYLRVEEDEVSYLVFSTEENSDYIRLGYFEAIPINTCVNTCLELAPTRLIFPEKTKPLTPTKEVNT